MPAAWVPHLRSGTGVTAVPESTSRIPFEGVQRRAWHTRVHQLIKPGSDVRDTSQPPQGTAGTRRPARCDDSVQVTGPARCEATPAWPRLWQKGRGRNEGQRPLCPPQTWHPLRLRQHLFKATGQGSETYPLNNLTRPFPPFPFERT